MLVVDASVAVKWLVKEPDSNAARSLVASGADLHAPRLMASEITSALARKAKSGEIGRAGAIAAMNWMELLPVHWNEEEAVSGEALHLALAFEHAVYDCVYLALAQRIGAVVVTADREFAAVAQRNGYGEEVVVLSDYAGKQ